MRVESSSPRAAKSACSSASRPRRTLGQASFGDVVPPHCDRNDPIRVSTVWPAAICRNVHHPMAAIQKFPCYEVALNFTPAHGVIVVAIDDNHLHLDNIAKRQTGTA